ncbi:MAG: amidohydrolase family protein [Pseudomonadota bacterium]|nr:amidohydrolase family protein [Pseudomonadota bacterium]
MSDNSMVIRNATIVDGTGGDPFEGDVFIKDGIIREVGNISNDCDKQIDAKGLILSPGFIDIHTHFDPQLCWDGYATPSIEHGVTTVVTGNCSLSLAPIRNGGENKIISMFQVIEDIKKPTFEEAVPFSWESFGEYLDHIKPGLGINVGALIGHSAVRLYVMGEDSQKREATDAEIKQMVEIVEMAMKHGALGVSSSYVDVDENFDPVPSRFSCIKEKMALAKAATITGRGVWQVVPYFIDMETQLKNIQELGDISLETGIMCTFQPVLSTPDAPKAERIMEALQKERDRGAKVFGQTMPRCFDLNMRLSETSMLLFGMPTWKSIMDLSLKDRKEAFSNIDNQKILVEEARNAQGMSAALPMLKVGQVYSDDNKKYTGKYLAEIAQTEEKEIGQVILDIANADDLKTEFQLMDVINSDKESVSYLIMNELCHFGASDAGAHITQFCGTGDTTHLLEHYVRDTNKISLSTAIHRMTKEVADDWGLFDRGEIKEGKAADLVLFDINEVGISNEEFVNDFPGEASRYMRYSKGYEKVIVNGAVVYENNEYTDIKSGTIV